MVLVFAFLHFCIFYPSEKPDCKRTLFPFEIIPPFLSIFGGRTAMVGVRVSSVYYLVFTS
jgi:hypothetical protein